MMLGYYPGCSLAGTGREYDLSLRAVMRVLDVDLHEIDDWLCCGATSAHATNHTLAAALPLATIAQAAAQGMDEVLAPCAACFNRLVTAQRAVQRDEHLRMRVQQALEGALPPRLPVRSILDQLEQVGPDAISARVTAPLTGMRVACYYGCLLLRPAEVADGGETEAPVRMERIVAATGAEAVDWNFRTECCGAAQAIAHPEIVVDLSARILSDARRHGATAVVVACPMCHSNLDTRQKAMRRAGHDMPDMPILYLTELLGLAFGLDERQLGLDMHLTHACGLRAAMTEVQA